MKPLVVGVGARSRGDDAVGITVASALASLGLAVVDVVEQASPMDLVPMLHVRDVVVIVDAMMSGAVPGTVLVLDEIPPGPGFGNRGTHGVGVVQAVHLAGTLGTLPRQLWFVGVEVAQAGYGEALSAAAGSAVPRAVDEVKRLLLGAVEDAAA